MDAPVKALNTEKAKALQAALAQIEKQFGKGTIMRLGEGEVIEDIQVVSTGSLGLDIALGVGGLPRGRVVEIYGPESSGKTTLTLQVIAEMQKLGGTCAFIDAEHALDTGYAQKLGVNLSDMLISQPDTGEQALEIVDSLVRSGSVDLVVIDSVAALTQAVAHGAAQAAGSSALARCCKGTLTAARTLPSISSAIFGLFLRNSRALSLPWPIFSPL